jgi:RNA polymerase sigma-70 factor (ECF subfamily)
MCRPVEYGGDVSVAIEELATEFEQHRGHLIGVAYRITGTLADAEDAVQEAWLRLARLDADQVDEIRDLKAWLTTVVSRIGLDRLRSAAVRRERYVGPWLPEPIVTAPEDDGPLAQVVRDDGIRMAAMVVLERLSPEQRVAFVLHDAFAVPFAEIAGILGCSEPAARQHASRGRRAVADADPPARASMTEQQDVLAALTTAVLAGDLDALVRLLHPQVVLLGDSDGKERTARRPMVGAEKVARFFLGLRGQYGVDALTRARPVLVNGDPGLYVPPGEPQHERWTVARRVNVIAVRDGRVAAVYDVVNPEKLAHVPA